MATGEPVPKDTLGRLAPVVSASAPAARVGGAGQRLPRPSSAAGFAPDAERAARPSSAQLPGLDPAADALAEFPQSDRNVLQLERATLAIRAASLADCLPDSLEKLQAYLGVASATYREQSRIADALRTAGAVIENRPADAARALELLMTHAQYDESDTRAALRMEANDVGSNQGTSGRAINPDPTDRVLRALAIAGTLDSPPYRACRPRFGTSTSGYVFAAKPTYAPGNIDRIIAAYRAFLPARLDTAAGSGDSGIGYLQGTLRAQVARDARLAAGFLRNRGEGARSLRRVRDALPG